MTMPVGDPNCSLCHGAGVDPKFDGLDRDGTRPGAAAALVFGNTCPQCRGGGEGAAVVSSGPDSPTPEHTQERDHRD